MKKLTYSDYGLNRNPFPPAAAGVPPTGIDEQSWPDDLVRSAETCLQYLADSSGSKAILVIGEYGSGKTSFLHTVLKPKLEARKILSFYFENPGTQLYDLANTVMRTVGRYEFAKALWEFLSMDLKSHRTTLFSETFSTYLQRLSASTSERRVEEARLQKALRSSGMIDDEEIAMRFSELVVETSVKPFFEYRDFLVGTKGTLVAEKQEPRYFKTLLRLLGRMYSPDGIAFVIDEFEDVAIGHRMNRSKSYEYLATLRSLLDMSQDENLWLVTAMTPDAQTQTLLMAPALMQRFAPEAQIKLEPWPLPDCRRLTEYWIKRERVEGFTRDPIFPFDENALAILEKRADLRLPRPLIKLLYLCLETAIYRQVGPPISGEFVAEVAKRMMEPQATGAPAGNTGRE
jgi:hypothetical protein